MDEQKQLHIMVTDDDPEIRNLLQEYLTKNQCHVTTASNGEELKTLLATENPDLIVMDLMMPGKTGIDTCKELRAQNITTPIIMLTGVTDDMEKILSLEIGADDYLTKPFNARELLARIKAVLRRTNFEPTSEGQTVEPDYQGKLLKFSGWTLNTASRQLFSSDNIEISLSSKAYDLLLVFLEHPQHVLSRDQLLTILCNRMAEPFDRSIDVQVSRLRQKLGDDPKDPKMIKTVRTGGYLFASPVKKF